MSKNKKLDALVKQTNITLLQDLNEVVNFCIGNQDPVDVSVDDIDTLPQLLAYVENNPRNLKRVKEAIDQITKLEAKISHMKDFLVKWEKMVEYLNK